MPAWSPRSGSNSRGHRRRIDRELWAELAQADLVGLSLPEAYGGGGYGMVELAIVLEGQGRSVAPVPLWSTIVLGAMPLAEFGSEARAERAAPRGRGR